MWVRVRNALRKFGIIPDPGSWIDPGEQVLLSAYPRRASDLARLQQRGIRLLINLHERPHPPGRLVEFNLTECHLPVRDFTAPILSQIGIAVKRLATTIAAGNRVAIHCGAGLGRSGTVAACYLIEQGHDWSTAVDMVRAARPGAIETDSQLAAVKLFADSSTRPGSA